MCVCVCVCVCDRFAFFASHTLRYAEQVCGPTERRIIANVLSGNIRAKAAMQHLAVVTTSMALENGQPALATTRPPKRASISDGSAAQPQKKPRYEAARSYDPCLVAELSVATRNYSEEGRQALFQFAKINTRLAKDVHTIDWSDMNYPLPYMAIRCTAQLINNFQAAGTILGLSVGGRHGKMSLDDTVNAQVIQLVTNYWDVAKQERCDILVGGGHDINGEHPSWGHMIVDISTTEHRTLIAQFPDNQFISFLSPGNYMYECRNLIAASPMLANMLSVRRIACECLCLSACV